MLGVRRSMDESQPKEEFCCNSAGHGETWKGFMQGMTQTRSVKMVLAAPCSDSRVLFLNCLRRSHLTPCSYPSRAPNRHSHCLRLPARVLALVLFGAGTWQVRKEAVFQKSD